MHHTLCIYYIYNISLYLYAKKYHFVVKHIVSRSRGIKSKPRCPIGQLDLVCFFAVGSDESLHLLATCYYRSGKVSQAYNLLTGHGARTPKNRFLLAKCCSDLNKWVLKKNDQGLMLWSQLSAIFVNFRWKNWRFSQKPMLWSNFCII
jgi:hypothetical protein